MQLISDFLAKTPEPRFVLVPVFLDFIVSASFWSLLFMGTVQSGSKTTICKHEFWIDLATGSIVCLGSKSAAVFHLPGLGLDAQIGHHMTCRGSDFPPFLKMNLSEFIVVCIEYENAVVMCENF